MPLQDTDPTPSLGGFGFRRTESLSVDTTPQRSTPPLRSIITPPFTIESIPSAAISGGIDILRYTAFQDVGFAIHPSYVEGQIQGGTAQGVGWALNDEYYMSDDGAMLNTILLDYRMPTTLDLPMIDTVLVEVNNPGHPFGVRGVGEANISPPMAALANAIHDAVGLRLPKLPMNPQAVSKAIREKAG